MGASTAYQQMIAKVDTSYKLAEKKIEVELDKVAAEHNKAVEKLETLKDKHEVLLYLNEFFTKSGSDETLLNNITNDLFKLIKSKKLQARLNAEKELLLFGYLSKMGHHTDISLPSIIDLNKEYRVRKHKVVCDILSSYLLEEEGFERYKEELEDAVNAATRATDLGTIEELEHSSKLFQKIFQKIGDDHSLGEHRLNFISYSTDIVNQMKKQPPVRLDEVKSKEALRTTHEKLKAQRRQDEKDLSKQLYQLNMLRCDLVTIKKDLSKIRTELEASLFNTTKQERILNQLREDLQALDFQREQFLNKPSIANYEEAMANLDLIEKRFKRIVTEAAFGRPSLVERFFTINKTEVERTYIREEKTNFHHVLEQVLKNENISPDKKRDLVRLSRESVLVNTHSGKFFFQRTGKTHTRQNLDELDKHFNSTTTNYSIQH